MMVLVSSAWESRHPKQAQPVYFLWPQVGAWEIKHALRRGREELETEELASAWEIKGLLKAIRSQFTAVLPREAWECTSSVPRSQATECPETQVRSPSAVPIARFDMSHGPEEEIVPSFVSVVPRKHEGRLFVPKPD